MYDCKKQTFNDHEDRIVKASVLVKKCSHAVRYHMILRDKPSVLDNENELKNPYEIEAKEDKAG